MNESISAPTDGQEPLSRSVKAIGIVLVGSILALCLAWWMFFHVPVAEGRKVAQSVAAAFNTLLNFTPQVTVQNIIIVEETRPASDLITARKDVHITHKIKDEWLHSKKEFEISGVFVATAGFDLTNKRCKLSIDGNPPHIVARFPKAKILAVTMKSFEIIKDEDGIFNKIKPEERESAIRQLTPMAIRTARDRSSLLADARENLDKQLQSVAREKNWKVSVKFE